MPFALTLTPVGDNMIRAERAFAAPPVKVWRALSEPDLIRQWQGTPEFPLTSVRMDFRVGGTWRYVWDAGEGGDVVAFGSYLEIVAPTRIVHTEAFEVDWTDGPATLTTTLGASEAGTRMVIDMVYSGSKGRDMALNSGGMEATMGANYTQLEALLAE